MHKAYRQTKLEFINLFVVFLLTFLLDCAFQNKLLFIDKVLKEEITKKILDQYMFWILVILFLIYLGNFFLIRIRNRENIAKQVYNNICKEIFNRFIKTMDVAPNFMRVSLLKAFDREASSPYLKVVGRYQTRSPIQKSKVVFNAGEGCAGIAYEMGTSIQKDIEESDHKNPLKYYEASEKVFKLNKNKARKLNDKACDFLCIPIKYFGEDEPWGILSIDSMKRGVFSEARANEIENAIYCLSAFLML